MRTLFIDPVEETVLSVRLDNAKRDTLCALDLLQRALNEARINGRTDLAVNLASLALTQQGVAARLIEIVRDEHRELVTI